MVEAFLSQRCLALCRSSGSWTCHGTREAAPGHPLWLFTGSPQNEGREATVSIQRPQKELLYGWEPSDDFLFSLFTLK